MYPKIPSNQISRTLGKARHTEGTLGRTLTLSFGNLCRTSLFYSSNLLFPGNLPEKRKVETQAAHNDKHRKKEKVTSN